MVILTQEKAALEPATLTVDLGVVRSPVGGEPAAGQTEAAIPERGEDCAQPNTACALGAAALSEAVVQPTGPPHESAAKTPGTPKRHGYRQDSPPEEIALLEQAQAGNAEAYGELYRLHRERIARYVAARVRNRSFGGDAGGEREAIADVVQDAFCEAFAGLRDAHHDVIGWLLAHAAKAYIRYARSTCNEERAVAGSKEHVRREYAYGHTWDERAPGAANEYAVSTIGRLSLVQALARLVPNQRRCIQHRYLEGQTQATTADLMGKSLGAARDAERRALRRLRQGLGSTPEVVSTAAGR
jgi:RNA polymerase sigma-70 factor, ECF subfamily